MSSPVAGYTVFHGLARLGYCGPLVLKDGHQAIERERVPTIHDGGDQTIARLGPVPNLLLSLINMFASKYMMPVGG